MMIAPGGQVASDARGPHALGTAASAGAHTSTQPVSLAAHNHAGALAGGYGALDWFDRIHVLPGNVALGDIRNPKQRNVSLYNAGRASESIDAINGTDVDGISLTGASAPFSLAARETRTLTIEATLDGPTIIDGQFVFDGASTDALLLISGERVVIRVWPLSPDWAQPVRERWQWRTDLQRAKDGTEYRREVYTHPRRGLEFRIVETDIAILDRLLSGWQSNPWVVPRWPDATPLTAAASADDTTLALDTSVGEWRAGGSVVLLGSEPEAHVIDAVNAGSVDLETPLTTSRPAGTKAYPGRDMRLALDINLQRPTAGVATGTVQFLADTDTEPGYTADDSDTTFDGEPVWLEEPNRAAPAPVGYARDATRLDSGVAPILVDDPTGDPIHGHGWEYAHLGRGEVDGFVQWLLARAGRLQAFWYPTWSMDMKVVQTINVGDTSVVIEPIDWSRWYAERFNRDVIAVETRAGAWHFARVTAAAIAGGQETLTLDRQLVSSGSDIAPGDVRRSCWLERVRLDTDRIELSWRTATVAESRLPLRGARG